jgi:hypothetical protein
LVKDLPMSQYDPDRIRLFTTEENYNPGIIVGEIRGLVTQLRETTDLIVKARSSKISDRRAKICQDYLNAFETTLFAFDHNQKIGTLSNSHQREILVMMDDILKGKREYAHFQLTRNADGIKELFSDKTFLVNTNTKQDK